MAQVKGRIGGEEGSLLVRSLFGRSSRFDDNTTMRSRPGSGNLLETLTYIHAWVPARRSILLPESRVFRCLKHRGACSESQPPALRPQVQVGC